MMVDVYLYGELSVQFGRHFRLDVKSAGEACRALGCMLKGFREKFMPGFYRVIRGPLGASEMDERFINLPMPCNQLHIIPDVAGSGGKKGKGIIKIIAGVALMVAAIVAAPFTGGASAMGAAAISMGSLGTISFGNIAMFGLSMLLSGAMSLLSPTPSASYGNREDAANTASFTFSTGAVNTVEQGGPVSLPYGRYLCGSALISGGVDIVQLRSSGIADDTSSGQTNSFTEIIDMISGNDTANNVGPADTSGAASP